MTTRMLSRRGSSLSQSKKKGTPEDAPFFIRALHHSDLFLLSI